MFTPLDDIPKRKRGFDPKAFATAFLEGQATDIKARLKEAREEGQRKKELARTAGMSQWKKRKSVANVYKNYVEFLAGQGMTPENLNYLVQNPKSLVEAHDAIKKYSETHRGSKLDADTINSMVDLSTAFVGEVGEDGNPLELDVLIKKMAGLYIDNHKPTSSDPNDKYENLLSSLLGLNATERANIKLQSQMVGDNISMLDLYDMAAAGDYVPEQLAPVSVNVGKIPTALTPPEQLRMQEDLREKATELFRIDNQNSTTESGAATWTEKKAMLWQDMNMREQPADVPLRIMELYGKEAFKELYKQGGIYEQMFDNPYILTADVREELKKELLGVPSKESSVGGVGKGVITFNTEKDAINAMLRNEIKEGDKIKILEKDEDNPDGYIGEVTKSHISRANEWLESQTRGRLPIKGSSTTMMDDTIIPTDFKKSSIRKIFDKATTKDVGYSIQGGVEVDVDLPELTEEEQTSLNTYIDIIKAQYDALPTAKYGGGVVPPKEYKGIKFKNYNRFLKARLKEEFPDVNTVLIDKMVDNLGI
tara:strand:+ start:548 stop:2158 length:1611 start_codon:yes stop_codon:yes gene_type:complete